MKLSKRINVLYLLSLWMFTGCGVSELDSTSTITTAIDTEDLTDTAVAGVSIDVMDVSTDNYKVLKLNGDKRLQIKLGSEEKDVYILFSNPENSVDTATVIHNQKVVEPLDKIQKSLTEDLPTYLQVPNEIQEFNNGFMDLKVNTDTNQKMVATYNKTDDVVEDEHLFSMGRDSTDINVTATAKKVVQNIDTSFGEKSLTIWVENDAYGDNCKKEKCVTDAMIDTLANKFLKSGSDNDIYDWVTNVFGEEWGPSNYSDLIGEPNHIDILLTDISNDDNPNGGVIGYFYSKDNFVKETYGGSNERIMFYIDSVMFANGTDGWDENDFWPQQVFSTLAHEFQHMIYFYQKNAKQGLQGTDAWLNEMLSESTEDLVAVKMNVDGPRNVIASRGDAGDTDNSNGRYPLFNKNNQLSPLSWDNQLANYSTVSSFGAYLLRNYGGAELLHDIVYNNYLNEDALMYAVHQNVNGKFKTFDDLIHEWGVAVLLSKRDDIASDSGELYNAGDFISSDYNNIHYPLGSVNFFNYRSLPTLSTTMGQVAPKSNYYYKVGEKLKGDIDVEILDTAGLNVSVVVVK
jgi:hypothetical protein